MAIAIPNPFAFPGPRMACSRFAALGCDAEALDAEALGPSAPVVADPILVSVATC